MTARGDFWARRKAAVEAEEAAEAQALQDEAVTAERVALEEKTDEEILTALNLPDPDGLQPGDDIRAFMAQAVPDRIRRRALRALWRLNPVLANVDGLVDYGEDFTDASKVIENLQTTYQVGKGMLKHVEELARQAEAEAEADADTEAAEDAEIPADPEATTEVEVPAALAETPEPEADPDPETREDQSDTRYVAAPQRRMRFAFDS